MYIHNFIIFAQLILKIILMKNLTLISALFIAAFGFSQAPNYVPTNGLVGFWPFNGNANDESGNGNNGTVNGATLTTDRFGVANKAYNFDGVDDYVRVTNNTSFTNSSEISFSFWISVPDYTLNSSGNPERNPIGMQKTLNSSGLQFETVDNFGSCCGAQFALAPVQFESSNPIPLNSSVHLVGLYFGSTLNLYQNGVLFGSSTGLFNLNTLTQDLYFGKEGSLGRNFKGIIDDIGIWNRPLTQCEIQDLYNSQLATVSGTGISVSPQPASIGSVVVLTTPSLSQNLQWQTNPTSLGWQNIPNNSNYSGASTNSLLVTNVQLANHNQPFRVILTSANCIDTSNSATIQIADTCMTTVYDTVLTTVTDTLIINTTLSLPAPNNENTILIYPNPASDHITIDNGNFSAMAGYSIKIENNAGQQVFQSAINQQQFYVDLSTWSGNGLYFVQLIDPQNNTVTVRKIVLQ
jgi:hypothetical protein